MGLLEQMNRRVKNFGIFDLNLSQAAAVFLALAIVKLMPQVMTLSIWWFLGLTVLFGLRPAVAFFVEQ
jgi:hypothetical protein